MYRFSHPWQLLGPQSSMEHPKSVPTKTAGLCEGSMHFHVCLGSVGSGLRRSACQKQHSMYPNPKDVHLELHVR